MIITRIILLFPSLAKQALTKIKRQAILRSSLNIPTTKQKENMVNTVIRKEDVFLHEVARRDLLQCNALLLINKRHDLDELKKLTLEISRRKGEEEKEDEEMAFLMNALYFGVSELYYCFRLPIIGHRREVISATFYSSEKDKKMAVGQKIIFFNNEEE